MCRHIIRRENYFKKKCSTISDMPLICFHRLILRRALSKLVCPYPCAPLDLVSLAAASSYAQLCMALSPYISYSSSSHRLRCWPLPISKDHTSFASKAPNDVSTDVVIIHACAPYSRAGMMGDL